MADEPPKLRESVQYSVLEALARNGPTRRARVVARECGLVEGRQLVQFQKKS